MAAVIARPTSEPFSERPRPQYSSFRTSRGGLTEQPPWANSDHHAPFRGAGNRCNVSIIGCQSGRVAVQPKLLCSVAVRPCAAFVPKYFCYKIGHELPSQVALF